jgi:glycosyltransferase involved in cell wall biosynthesis
MPLAVEQLDLSGFDIVISSSHAVAKGVLTGPDQLHVSYVHSPLRYAWDMQHEYLREAGMARGLKSLLTRWLLHRLRLWDVRTANGVDQFVANSAFIARRVRKAYRREAEVIYPPVDLSAFIPSAAARGQAYVTVSRMVPYKRVDLIVEAFAGMPDKQLIVIGDGPEMAKVRAKAGSNVQILGHLPFEAMREHVQRARAFVFAAQEDFGIAPVEAQACGTPVIAYGRGGAAETVRGLQQNPPTGVLFEEQTVEALREAVRQFEQHAARITPAACRQNAERFAIGVFRQRMAALVVSRWSGLQGEVKSGVTGFKPIQPKAL